MENIEEIKKTKLNFGKYKNKTLGDLLTTDTSYLTWLTQCIHSKSTPEMCALIRNVSTLIKYETSRTTLKDAQETVINFGMHKTLTLGVIGKHNKSYLTFVRHKKGTIFEHKVKLVLEELDRTVQVV